MAKLTKKELAALAMHEIMQREQRIYAERANEQRKISAMSNDQLRKIVGLDDGKENLNDE